MTLSKHDKTVKRALLVIDVQNEYFTGQLPVTYPSGSLEKILAAIDAALSQQIPVIAIRHTQLDETTAIFRKDSPQWQLHPEIAKRHYSLLIDKNFPGSFTGTNLEAWLRKHEIDTAVISGYMTQMCCNTTARHAAHLSFSVEFLSDATGTLDFETKAATATAQELHRSTLVAQESFYGETEEKPQFTGKRIKRGLYRTQTGFLCQADVLSSYNILRKAFSNAFSCYGIGRCVVHPRRINLSKPK